MSTKNRALLEATLFNLRYDMDCIGENYDPYEETAGLTISDLENLISDFLENM